MAKDVQAPVPLVTMTMRTPSRGASTSASRSRAGGIGADPALDERAAAAVEHGVVLVEDEVVDAAGANGSGVAA